VLLTVAGVAVVAPLALGAPLAAATAAILGSQVVAAAWGPAGRASPDRRLAAVASRLGAAAGPAGAAAAVGTAFVLPLVLAVAAEERINGQNDFTFHVERAREIQLAPFETTVPHVLFGVLTRVAALPLRSLTAAGAAVVLLAVAALGVVVVLLAVRPLVRGTAALSGTRAFVLAVCVVVAESPTYLLPDTHLIRPDRAHILLHPWWNPTAVLLLPLAVLYLALVVRFVQDVESDRRSRRVDLAVLGVGVLTLLAKPALQLGLGPALLVLLVVRWWRRPPPGGRARAVGAVAAWIGLPTALLLGWQLWFVEEAAHPEYRGGLTWAPLDVARAWGADRPAFWLSLALPMLVLVLEPLRAWRDETFRLTVLVVVAALAVFLGFAATSASRDSANIGHGVQVATFLAVLASARLVLERRTSDGPHAGLRNLALVGVLASYVVAGGWNYVLNLENL